MSDDRYFERCFELLATFFKKILVNTGLCRDSTNVACLHVHESEISELQLLALGRFLGIKTPE